MPDRTINFGDDAADARYRIQDTSSTGGDLILAEDLDGGAVLLEYDYSASEWVSRGPVNLSGNDITNAGTVSAGSLEAGKRSFDNVYTEQIDDNAPFNKSGSQSYTLTLSKSYDKIILDGEITETSGSKQEITLQVDGVTSNKYFYRKVDGSTASFDTSFQLADSLGATIQLTGMEIDGKQNGGYNINGPPSVGGENAVLTGAVNEPTTDPDRISQITIAGGSGTISLTDIYIRGVDIA